MHVLGEQGVTLAGVQHDPLLYAYLLDPTYSTYGLAEVAYRKFNLKLGTSLAEAADITLRLTEKLREEVEKAGLGKVYDEIDLPLVPVLARMEEAGVKLDCEVLAEMSQRLEREMQRQGARDLRQVRLRVQHQFAQAARRRAVQQAATCRSRSSTARARRFRRRWMCWKDWRRARSPAHGAGLPAAFKAEVHLRGCASGAAELVHQTVAHHVQHGGFGDGAAVVGQSELAEYSDPHRTGPRDSRCIRRRAGTRSAVGRLLADRVAAAGALLRRQAAGGGLSRRARTFTR